MYDQLSKVQYNESNLTKGAIMLTGTAIINGTDIKLISRKICGLYTLERNIILLSRCGINKIYLNLTEEEMIFYRKKIKKTTFKNTQLRETDFTECDLTESLFDNCDLTSATFDHTIIEKADFRTSYNYTIDPEINRIKKAKFSISGISGLLEKYDIIIDRTI